MTIQGTQLSIRDPVSTAWKRYRAPSASQTVSLQSHNARIQAGGQVALPTNQRNSNHHQGRVIGAIADIVSASIQYTQRESPLHRRLRKEPAMTQLEKAATGVKIVTRAARIDMKFEALVIPVSDVDRAKRFYANLGWRLDADFPFDNGFRVVQFTPPGSGCSVQFGANITSAAPGSPRAFTSSSATSRRRAAN